MIARLCASLTCLLALPVLAWPHAYLVKSVPARRAILFQSPGRIQLFFNERLEARFSFVSVTDSNGEQVSLNDIQVAPNNPKQLSVGLPALPPGIYRIRFRVLSVDGHVAEDDFPFTIRGSRAQQ